MPSADNSYKWLITFLVYDNAWYDKEFIGEDGYIPLTEQNKELYNRIADLPYNELVKIMIVEVKIDKKNQVLEVGVCEKIMSGLSAAIIDRSVNRDVLTNDSSLIKILNPIYQTNNAERNMVITIGHGSVFGINLYSDSRDIVDKKNKGLFIKDGVTEIDFSKELKMLEAAETFTGIKNIKQLITEIDAYLLTATEIDGAFNEILPNKKVDVLVLDNCLMQNVYTQYQLRNSVKYLVAAESGISYPGFPCTQVIEMICSNPDMPTKNIAEAFVDDKFIKPLAEHALANKKIKIRWCLNSVCLDNINYDEMQTSFEDFFQLLDSLISSNNEELKDEIYQVVKTTNKQLFGYNLYSLHEVKIIDLHVFLQFFKKQVIKSNTLVAYKSQLLTKADNLIASLGTSNVKTFISEDFYPPENNYEDTGKDIGYGFLLPLKPTRHLFIDMYFRKKETLSFTPGLMKKSIYPLFINKLWKKSPPGRI